jgi:hypothetical protein
MAAPVPLRPDFDAAALRALAKRSREPDQTRRLLALSAIYAGSPRSEAAALGGVGLQTVRDWVLAFNAEGPEGLISGKAPGARPRLNADLRAALNVWPAPSARCVWMAMRSASTYPVSGPCPGQDGYPRALGPHKAYGVEHRI